MFTISENRETELIECPICKNKFEPVIGKCVVKESNLHPICSVCAKECCPELVTELDRMSFPD